MSRLLSIERGSSAQTLAKLLEVLYPDARTALDTTWGRGRFWGPSPQLEVVGLDISPHGQPDLVADFRALPFADDSFDVAVFDPPYHTDVSRTTASIMHRQFGSYPTLPELQVAVQVGVLEASRVSRLGIVVKVQDYVHGSKAIRMTRWVEAVMPDPPYGVVHQLRTRKLMSPRWTDQLSVYASHTTFLAFRHGSQVHKRRRRAS